MFDVLNQQVDLFGMDGAEVLAALYNNAVIRNLKVFEDHPFLSRAEAAEVIERSEKCISEIHGLRLDLKFNGHFLDVRGYDRHYGIGEARRVISELGLVKENRDTLNLPVVNAGECAETASLCESVISGLVRMHQQYEGSHPLEADFIRILKDRLQREWLHCGKGLTAEAFGFLMLETMHDMQRGCDSHCARGGIDVMFPRRARIADKLEGHLSKIVTGACPPDFSREVLGYLARAQTLV